MVQYKWVALSNTTLGVLMASINSTIILISLPAIFRGIAINPLLPTSFPYLLWILFGYSIVTATMLVTFGRLSDMYGRVRLYNMGFAIFTAGSILLFLTPGKGDFAANLIIAYRIIQGLGAAFLFSNSAAILTDAFPHTERGRALGLNQVAALAGSLIGLILGGILAVINWRYIFLVSVPVGLAGTAWSYLKLKEIVKPKKAKIDYSGNLTFAGGLTLLLIAITYGLIPYGGSIMGWGDPWVIISLGLGAALLLAFPFIEVHIKEPMFRLELFRRRIFSAANLAGFLGAVGRGGVQIMLIILLQGIWLPLHGYSYQSAPFWAGIFMIPMMAGFIVMGPISGWLSDIHGARLLSTTGMLITAASFIALSLLPYDFVYWEFGVILFFMGVGSGMFASPNTASIMNSVPPEQRGAASGMRSTLQNAGMTASLGMFFVIIIIWLAGSLPAALLSALTNLGLSQSVSQYFAGIPPTGALFAAFLGYNPVITILSTLPSSIVQTISSNSLAMATITGEHWFPMVIASPFMGALRVSFIIGAILSFIGAIASAMRGRIYIYDVENNKDNGRTGS
ncbi:MAG: MFS transporter [Nitrososphaerota archaeon]|nr:MFS transporter [Nitrososphaerota archaeon]MDG7050935.1 MFS transporter [Nitrososphaerota archaeon]